MKTLRLDFTVIYVNENKGKIIYDQANEVAKFFFLSRNSSRFPSDLK